MPRRLARPARAAALLSLYCLGACSGWREVPMPSPGTMERVALGARARVTTGDFTTLVVRDAAFWRDSLVGWHGEAATPQRTAVPLADLRRVERRGFSSGRTLLLIGGIAGGLLVTIGVLQAAALNDILSGGF